MTAAAQRSAGTRVVTRYLGSHLCTAPAARGGARDALLTLLGRERGRIADGLLEQLRFQVTNFGDARPRLGDDRAIADAVGISLGSWRRVYGPALEAVGLLARGPRGWQLVAAWTLEGRLPGGAHRPGYTVTNRDQFAAVLRVLAAQGHRGVHRAKLLSVWIQLRLDHSHSSGVLKTGLAELLAVLQLSEPTFKTYRGQLADAGLLGDWQHVRRGALTPVGAWRLLDLERLEGRTAVQLETVLPAAAAQADPAQPPKIGTQPPKIATGCTPTEQVFRGPQAVSPSREQNQPRALPRDGGEGTADSRATRAPAPARRLSGDSLRIMRALEEEWPALQLQLWASWPLISILRQLPNLRLGRPEPAIRALTGWRLDHPDHPARDPVACIVGRARRLLRAALAAEPVHDAWQQEEVSQLEDARRARQEANARRIADQDRQRADNAAAAAAAADPDRTVREVRAQITGDQFALLERLLHPGRERGYLSAGRRAHLTALRARQLHVAAVEDAHAAGVAPPTMAETIAAQLAGVR